DNTRMAKKTISVASQTVEPHCPGEIHTPGVVKRSTTIAKPAGLKTCLPSIRSRNFEPMAITAARAESQGSFVRNSRLSDNPVIRGERKARCGSGKARVHNAWVASAATIAAALLMGCAPKSSQPRLKASNVDNAAI